LAEFANAPPTIGAPGVKSLGNAIFLVVTLALTPILLKILLH